MTSLPRPRFTSALALLAATACSLPLRAAEDATPVDTAQMLQALRQLREQSTVQAKAGKQKVLQELTAAAASGEAAVQMWEKAVMATQFDGLNKEQTAFKAWREREGEAFKESEAKNAARLYFTWLGLTVQRSAGTPVKDMLPAILRYTQDLATVQAVIDKLEDEIQHEKDLADGKHGPQQKSIKQAVKKTAENILNKGLAGSMVVDWMRIGEWVAVEKWEGTPGNFDGIFETIVLPELRAQRDPRVLDYWDARIKREAAVAMESKREFEHEKFNTHRLPILLGERALEFGRIGQKNRGATEIFNVIRKYPNHPRAAEWMGKLEELLRPPAPAPVAPAAPAAGAPAAAAPAPAPAPVPAAR